MVQELVAKAVAETVGTTAGRGAMVVVTVAMEALPP